MPIFACAYVDPDMLIILINHIDVSVFDSADSPTHVFHENHIGSLAQTAKTVAFRLGPNHCLARFRYGVDLDEAFRTRLEVQGIG